MNMTTPADVNHLSVKRKQLSLPLQRITASQTVCALPFRKPQTGVQRLLPSFDVNNR